MSSNIYDKEQKKLIPFAGNSHSALVGLDDVVISSPIDGQALVYDETTGKWINGEGATKVIIRGFYNAADGKFYKESTYTTEIEGNVDSLYISLDKNTIYRYDATDPTPAFVQIGGSENTVFGYYNETDGKFYEEATFVTEIPGEANKIYIGMNTDTVYRYQVSTLLFIPIGGNAFEYVDTLPVAPDIKDKIYGIEATHTKSETIETTCDETDLVDAGFVIQDTGVLVPGSTATFTYQDTEIGEIDYDASNFTIKDAEGTQIGDVLAVDDSISLVKTTTTKAYEYYIGNATEQELSEIVLDSSLEYLTAADIDELMSSVAGQQWDYLADVIVDTATSTKKVWSSSKITTELSTTLDASKTYTDEQISRFRNTSYVLVSSTAEMTDPSVLYLLPIVGEDDTYEIYALIKDASDVYVPTAIGTTQTKLEDYYTKLEADALFVKGTDVITKTKYGNEVGEVNNLTTIAKEVVSAINELKTVTDTFETENIIWP